MCTVLANVKGTGTTDAVSDHPVSHDAAGACARMQTNLRALIIQYKLGPRKFPPTCSSLIPLLSYSLKVVRTVLKSQAAQSGPTILAKSRQLYLNRSREPIIWQIG